MSLYKQFATSNELETKGILVEYGQNDDGSVIAIRIARAGGTNHRYNTVLERAVKPYRRQIQNETIDRDTMQRLMREVYADSVVIGWENVQDKDGKNLPFTRENVIKLFEDLPELFEDVQEQAQRAALYRDEILEQAAKN